MTAARRFPIVFIQLLGLVLASGAARDAAFQSSSIAMSKSALAFTSGMFPLSEHLLAVRGGDIEMSNVSDDGVVMKKIQNILRNVLQFGDKKVPVVSNFLRSCIKSVEKMTGLSLLPAKKGKKSKKKGDKKRKAKLETEDVDEKETEDVEEADKAEAVEAKPKRKKTAALKKPSSTTKKHLTSTIKNTNPNYRIQRELKEFIKSPPPNLSVQVGSNMRVWIITMVGANNTIYEGDIFKLRVSFPPQYPTVPPSVYFLQGFIPLHEHVYTNGDICLSLLGKDWRPTMTAQSIAVSILSILSSAQAKSIPMDNARHAGNKPGEYQKDWVYHDDNC